MQAVKSMKAVKGVFMKKIINRIKSCRNNTAECAEDCSEEKSSEVCARALRKRRLKTILRILLIVSALAVTAIIIFFAQFFKINEWQEFSADKILNSDRSVLIYDADGTLISTACGGDERIPVSIEALPEYVKYAFISAEDTRFYEHKGIDFIRILGAAWADIKAGELKEGASTIGQQLIKLSHLSSEKTFERKVEEAYLSMRMEKQFTKDEILEMYMNFVYFGGGFYGIEAASLGYFGVHASDLSIAQSAQLAGILKSPSTYAPHLNAEKSLGRRNTVLGQMHEYGRISDEEYSAALEEKVELRNAIPKQYSYYIDFVLSRSAQILGMSLDEFLRSGAQVYTTLDTDADNYCTALINDSELMPCKNAQGAIVLLRSDGSIAAINGGRGEYTRFCFNRAVDAERQPGSLIKPILCYAPAVELRGSTAASTVDDSPRSFDGYSPRNSGDKYMGKITLRTALAKSLNIPAVELLSEVGIPNAVLFAEHLGISFEGENLSLALALGGFTHGVSPLEISGAYCALSGGGRYTEPFAVTKIVSPAVTGSDEDSILYEHRSEKTHAMCAETAFIVTSMLRTAVDEGTAKVLSETNLPITAKTGTNLDSGGEVRDAWLAAYTCDYTAVVWLGTDSAEFGTLPEGTTGGNSASLIAKELFNHLYSGKEAQEFPVPDGIRLFALDKAALETEHKAVLATAYTPDSEIVREYFPISAAPSETSKFWQLPSPPQDVSWRSDERGNPAIRFTAQDSRLCYRIIRAECGVFGALNSQTERCIAEISGSTGEIEFIDFTALPGKSYFYCIQTVNPCISVHGLPAASDKSRLLRIFCKVN